ncbi:MAG: hypothetical protein NZ853_10330 [Leptospiraceae bacterium]|nr:hypothetical protein [Leptospiraceae bacterium]MDW7974946.1 hypothetical protein [Leptospiraceae bacterium]
MKWILSIFVLISFGLMNCSSATRVAGGEQFEGWHSENGIDTFYVRTAARASENAIKKQDEEMMKVTCIESAKLQAMDNIIRKMIGETIEAQSGMLDGQATSYAITSIRSGVIKGVNTKECAPRGGSWQNCECIHYVSGTNLKREVELEVKKAAQR